MHDFEREFWRGRVHDVLLAAQVALAAWDAGPSCKCFRHTPQLADVSPGVLKDHALKLRKAADFAWPMLGAASLSRVCIRLAEHCESRIKEARDATSRKGV